MASKTRSILACLSGRCNSTLGALPQFEALRQQLKATAADLVARLRELGCSVTSAVVSPAKPSAEQPAGSQLKLRSYQVLTAVRAARRMLVLASACPIICRSADGGAISGGVCSTCPWAD